MVNLLVQHLFSLQPNLEVKVAEAWGILRNDYHGKSFERRQCSKLLNKCDALALLVPSECLPIIDCLRAFTRVAEATFGHRLSSNNEEAIGQFGVNFTRLMSQFRISMTTKVHILLHNAPHFIRLTGMPLGPFSEQVVEEQHRRYKAVFNRYRINCPERINYPGRFLNSVLHYNSYHI